MYFLTFKADFAAAHRLRGYRGKCERLHGHNYRVEVVIGGEELDSAGMLVDFLDLKVAVNAVLEGLDHTNLNDLPAFGGSASNPSAENIARFISEEVAKTLPRRAEVESVTVHETDRCSATYRKSARAAAGAGPRAASARRSEGDGQ